jgi:hypothetical protein
MLDWPKSDILNIHNSEVENTDPKEIRDVHVLRILKRHKSWGRDDVLLLILAGWPIYNYIEWFVFWLYEGSVSKRE